MLLFQRRYNSNQRTILKLEDIKIYIKNTNIFSIKMLI